MPEHSTVLGLVALIFGMLAWPSSALGQGAGQSFDEFSQRAEFARTAGRTSEAISAYEKALQIRPDWAEGRWYLGTLYAETGRFSEAIKMFGQLTEANPTHGPAWASLGLSEFEVKDFQSSRVHLQKAQEVGFQGAPYLENITDYHLALLLNLNGEFEDAFSLLASHFGKEALAEQTRVALAMSVLRIPLLPEQVDPGKDALISDAGEAAELLVGGNFDQAFRMFQQMLKDYPQTPFLHYAYGSALDFNSRYDEAEIQLREEAQFMPRSPLPYMRMAAILLKSHRPADARPLAERAEELAPESATAHRILAKVWADLGKSDLAAQETANAQSLEPEKPGVNSVVAAFYLHHPSSPDSFISNAKTEISASGDFESLNAKAIAAAQAGRTEESITHYLDALRLRPDWDEGWSQLGTLFYIAGRPTEGIAALKNSLAIGRERAEAWVFLGLCEFEMKDLRNAFLHLERGREVGFHGTVGAQRLASLRLAELRIWSGDFDGAKDLLIPEVDRNQLTPTIKTALGLMLLRIPQLPDQIEPSHQALVREAGETAALLYAERYNEAFQRFDQMSKDFPNTPSIHYAYGSALESLSQHERAEAQLREEIRVAPNSALPYARMAEILLKTGRAEEAVSNAEHAAKLDMQAPGGHELLGRALLDLGKIDAAVQELETANRLAPNYPEVHFHLARAYGKAHRTLEAERERALFTRLNATQDAEKGTHNAGQALFTPYEHRSPSLPDAKRSSSDPSR